MFVVLLSAGLKPADAHVISIFQSMFLVCCEHLRITELAGFQTSGHEPPDNPSIPACMMVQQVTNQQDMVYISS